jgi:hypothetical protein
VIERASVPRRVHRTRHMKYIFDDLDILRSKSTGSVSNRSFTLSDEDVFGYRLCFGCFAVSDCGIVSVCLVL